MESKWHDADLKRKLTLLDYESSKHFTSLQLNDSFIAVRNEQAHHGFDFYYEYELEDWEQELREFEDKLKEQQHVS